MARTSQERLTAEMDGMRIEVAGLTETLRALSKAGADSEDMRELMHSTGQIVADAGTRLAPIGATGALSASIRAGRGKTKAVVRAGTAARVPYAGVVHYGWPARNIRPQPFMVRALRSTERPVVNHIEQGLKDLLKKNALI